MVFSNEMDSSFKCYLVKEIIIGHVTGILVFPSVVHGVQRVAEM